jgi:integrase
VTQRGSVFQRSNGRYVASIRVGSRTIQRYGKTRADADKKLDELLRQHYQGTLVQPTKVTLREWGEQWLEGLELRPSSRRVYGQVLSPIWDAIGHTRLDKLTPLTLSLCFSQLHKGGKGARQLQLAHGYLRACLDRAVDLDVLARNPMRKVPRPKWVSTPRTYWTAAETARFVHTCAATSNRWGPLFATLATCGLRVSEALALRSSEIDLDARTIHVRHALVWAGEQCSLVPTKTTSSNRLVTVPDVTTGILSRLSRPLDPEQPVFLNSNGNPPRLSQLHKSLASVCREATVPRVNVHGLRHVAAALAYLAVKDAHAVKERLGHSDVTTTMRLYSYLMRNAADVAQSVDVLLTQNHASSEMGNSSSHASVEGS